MSISGPLEATRSVPITLPVVVFPLGFVMVRPVNLRVIESAKAGVAKARNNRQRTDSSFIFLQNKTISLLALIRRTSASIGDNRSKSRGVVLPFVRHFVNIYI